MSENAASPTASDAFRKLVEDCRDASELQEALRRHQEESGQPSAAPAPPPVVDASRDSHGNYFVKIYPHGNDAYEIFADSQGELDRKIAAIYKLYGK